MLDSGEGELNCERKYIYLVLSIKAPTWLCQSDDDNSFMEAPHVWRARRGMVSRAREHDAIKETMLAAAMRP